MKVLLATFIALATSLFIGCALFNSNEDSTAGGSFAAGAPGSNVPVPVEIADDIAMIADGRMVANVGATGAQDNLSGATTEPTAVVDDSQLVKELPEKDSTTRSAKGKSGTVRYKVKPGDTLMKISFAHYANVYRWREIYRANRAKIADYNRLVNGTILEIHGVTYVVITRNGKPYLIRWGDTLGKISAKVYGTKEFWRELWKNNPELIKNPNKIYADFKLYYRPISTLQKPVENRNPASSTESN